MTRSTAILLGVLYALYVYDCEAKIKPLRFGPYFARIASANSCIEINKNSAIVWNYNITKLPNDEEEFVGKYNFTRNVHFTKGFLNSIPLDPKLKSYTFRQEISQPCKGMVFSYILTKYFNPDKKCIIKKGTYIMKLNVNELLHRFVSAVTPDDHLYKLEFWEKNKMVKCINAHMNISAINNV